MKKVEVLKERSLIESLNMLSNILYDEDNNPQYYFIPMWFEFENNKLYSHSLGNIPENLKDKILELRRIEKTPITGERLRIRGFKIFNGVLALEVSPDCHVEIKESKGYFYPAISQIPDMGEEQVVSLNRVQYMEELENIINLIK